MRLVGFQVGRSREECHAWGTISEADAVKVKTTAAVVVDRPAIWIGEVVTSRSLSSSVS
jgi:hypothetical protein